MTLGAVILSGGASRRMGRDKAVVDWRGRPAIDHVVDLARAVGARDVVVAGPTGHGHPFVADETPLAGPCGGIGRGLDALAAGGCERALVLAVDAPTIRPADLAPLLDHAAPGAAYAGLRLPFVVDLAKRPRSDAGWPIARYLEAAGLAQLACAPDAEARLRGANSPVERERLLAESQAGAQALPRLRWRAGAGVEAGERVAPEETPVALVHDGSTTAVMMATPADLEDFALGFSLSEGVIEALSDVRDLEIVEGEAGVEVRMWLAHGVSTRLAARRRRLAGPTGCGLCGVDSLAEAVRAPRKVAAGGPAIPAEELLAALRALEARQPLGAATRAVHAAGLWRDGRLAAVREDVGRHNALDKLIGAVARERPPTAPGVLLLTSRVSVEMVQKATVLGAPVLCAISAPTALAVRMARDAGLTLAGVARADGLEVFCGAERIAFPADADGPRQAPPAGAPLHKHRGTS